MNSPSTLTWSPTIHFVRDILSDKQQLLLIIAPFIKLVPLKELVETCLDISSLQVIARWRASDLVQNVTDVEIYPYLQEKGIPLFIHNSIHLKLLVFDRSLGFHSSGNITRSGLGIETAGNIEIGCPIELLANDWKHLYRLLAESIKVDDHIYATARQYITENKMTDISLPNLTLESVTGKSFLQSSLPASDSPQLLYDFYSGKLDRSIELEVAAACVSDLVTFSIPDQLQESEFYKIMRQNFRAHPFINALVQFIKDEGSVRFGAVNAWLTDHCQDTPRPYRRDMKTTCRRLYDWLSYFYEEITWDTPNYSMVIYWKAN